MSTTRLVKKIDLIDVPVSFNRRWTEEPGTNGFNTEGAGKITRIVLGPLTLDLKERLLFVQNGFIELTAKEFELMKYLMQNPGVNCSLKEILEHVWGNSVDTSSNIVEVYMYYLWRKLDRYKLGRVLQGVQGAWYRFNVPE